MDSDPSGAELRARVQQLESAAHEANRALSERINEQTASIDDLRETLDLQADRLLALSDEVSEARAEIEQLEAKLDAALDED